MRVPHRVAGSTTSDAFDANALNTAGTATYAAGSLIAAGEYWDAANVSQLERYDHLDATDPVVALGLAEAPVAPNTDRTPFTADDAATLVRERKSAADISKAGDWYLDADVGVLFIHSTTWSTLVADSTTVTFSYSFYTDTGVASAHRYVHFDGPCRPGDFVTVDSQSNFTVASASQISSGDRVVGRVLEVQHEPRPLLKEVKTAWDLSGLSASSQMPGSATKGFTDLITLSQETVADSIVILNVRV